MAATIDRDDIETLIPTDAISLAEPPSDKKACIEFLLDQLVDAGRVEDRGAAFEALLFMILVPEEGADDHLDILSSLSRALMHEEVRDDLHSVETPVDVQETLGEAVA